MLTSTHGLIIVFQYSCARDSTTSPRRLPAGPLDLERAWNIFTRLVNINPSNVTVITDIRTDGIWRDAGHLHVLDTADILEVIPYLVSFRKRSAGCHLCFHFSGHGISMIRRGIYSHGLILSGLGGTEERILWERDLLWLLTDHGGPLPFLTIEGSRMIQGQRNLIALHYPISLKSIPPPQSLFCIFDCCYAGGLFKLPGVYNSKVQNIKKIGEETIPFPIVCLCAAAPNLEAGMTIQGSLLTMRIMERMKPLNGHLDIEDLYDKIFSDARPPLQFSRPMLTTSFHDMKTIILS